MFSVGLVLLLFPLIFSGGKKPELPPAIPTEQTPLPYATLEEIAENVFYLHFTVQEDMGNTFLRFQEYYESPRFRGVVGFTLEEFIKWYIPNSEDGRETGQFTYPSKWNAYNIPSSTLEPFYEGQFDPLSEKEQWFLDLFATRRGQ
tara:strand:+ start:380 stop:817 length:438 start_codon:yes stop_codon:yes gene_type:complete